MIAARSMARPSVVLVADRTLSADYGTLFEAIFATMQTTEVPAWLMRGLLSRPAPVRPNGRAVVAPLGLRRVQAALLQAGLANADVAVVTPETLPRVLGPWVRIVGVSSSDPLGVGMSNSTTVHFCRGALYTRVWMDRLMRRIRRAKRAYGFAVVAGGSGAWQYIRDADAAAAHGIDTIFEGYFEQTGPALFGRLLAGDDPPPYVRADGAALPVAPIRAASTMGVVELSRGCGKGCGFCTAGRMSMRHVPAETILNEMELNRAAGLRGVVNSSEDFFRYGGCGSRVNFDALHALLDRARRIAGVRLFQLDHGNVSSVVQLTPDQLCEVRRLLRREGGAEYAWVNVGVESASGRLVAANGPAKAAPFDADDWEAMVRQAAARLDEAGFFGVFSFVLGLPGETPQDVQRTRRLVAELTRRPAAVFPVFYQPVRSDAGEPMTPRRMTAAHLALFAECYEANFRWVPRLFWDNQRAVGVTMPRRLLQQGLGRGEVLAWRSRIRRLGRRLVEPASAAGCAVATAPAQGS
ncbi:MAG: B12-binding domain-containing radical SAM protein [Phycisphaerae bacterium]|nr:B12-binding domain-containing radical SAM protein [Phycisphaerae bacterium]